MIKSPQVRGADLQARLAKHQRWVDAHAHDFDAPDRFDARAPVISPVVSIDTRSTARLRMAKAAIRRPVSDPAERTEIADARSARSTRPRGGDRAKGLSSSSGSPSDRSA